MKQLKLSIIKFLENYISYIWSKNLNLSLFINENDSDYLSELKPLFAYRGFILTSSTIEAKST